MTTETAIKIARSATLPTKENTSIPEKIRSLHRAALSHLAIAFSWLLASTASFRYESRVTAVGVVLLIGSGFAIIFLLFRVVQFTSALNVLVDRADETSKG